MKTSVLFIVLFLTVSLVHYSEAGMRGDDATTNLHYYTSMGIESIDINFNPNHMDTPVQYKNNFDDYKLINFIRGNVSAKTQLPYSFQIHKDNEEKIYARMGNPHSAEGIIERSIVNQGLIIYDGAVAQIVLSMFGTQQDMKLAEVPVDVYWSGKVGKLFNIRAGYPINRFVYDSSDPERVSSNLKDKGKRGFVFRIINADGEYLTHDPLDGKKYFEGFPGNKRIHWEDWKPVAGENAWIVMAALHIYHQKYFDPIRGEYEINEDAKELKLAREIARAAMILQAENGGIRMAPKGVYRNPKDFLDPNIPQGEWWYNQISSENNASWYGAFQMLYAITKEEKYQTAFKGIEEFYFSVWDEEEGYFHQGKNFAFGAWQQSTSHFALDVQTWGVAALSPTRVDERLGVGASYRLWRKSRELSGVYDEKGVLQGVGYIEEHDRLSVEWTAGAILMTRMLAEFYKDSHPHWAMDLNADADSMREGVEYLRQELDHQTEGYAYSSRRGWIPFGWNSHDPEVISLASSGWMVFVDQNVNPFVLPFMPATDGVQLVQRGR